MPRPSKFTEPVKNQILAVLKVGGSRETACAVAGLSTETLRVWLKQGLDEEDHDISPWADFRREVLAAEAEPRFKALAIVEREMDNNPMLAWKVIERREPGYAPPMPGKTTSGPQVQINLSLAGSSAALPSWIDAEVIEDAQEVPALGDGGGDAPADPES